jgi:hypothetical protein
MTGFFDYQAPRAPRKTGRQHLLKTALVPHASTAVLPTPLPRQRKSLNPTSTTPIPTTSSTNQEISGSDELPSDGAATQVTRAIRRKIISRELQSTETPSLPRTTPLFAKPKLGSVWTTDGASWETRQDANFQTVIRGVLFSPPGRDHRVRLIRQWANEHMIMFVHQAPGLANEVIDDAQTIADMELASALGYGGCLVGCLKTFVTDTSVDVQNRGYNDSHLCFMALSANKVVLDAPPSAELTRVAKMLRDNSTTGLYSLTADRQGVVPYVFGPAPRRIIRGETGG